MTAVSTLFSAIQPSGALTLGNLLGAITQWKHFLTKHRCFFALADLHAITVRQHPERFAAAVYDLLAVFLASGLNESRATIFLQSQVAMHAQLAWLLMCHTYMGELARMTQYKDKAQRHANNINAGLFTYPVLMAADILLYQTQLVPVGQDQRQHLEIARDIAVRMNSLYKTSSGELFVVPEGFIPEASGRIMSLQDPTKKMSKSDENLDGTILLTDSKDVISRKFKRAVTDSECSVRLDTINKPGVSNLLNILASVSEKPVSYWEKECQAMNYGQFKSLVADQVITYIAPLQEAFMAWRADKVKLQEVLAIGAENASQVAQQTLNKVHQAMGFVV